jgi:F-type H+-transporting ATPase subunit b
MMMPLAAGLLSPNPGLFVWTLVVFGLLLFLLSKFAWKPIAASLTEREKTIEESIQRAENALAEARQLQSDNEAARREAEAQARRLIADANEAAERVRTDRLAQLDAELTARRAQADAELDRQKQTLREELRTEVADLAVQAAERILREKMDGSQQRRLVDDFLATLPKN